MSTPYQDFGDKNVVKFFEEIGVQVLRIALLKCGSATDIAHVPEDWCEKVIRGNLVYEGVEAIGQCGTNLSMVSLSDRLERGVGIPIIRINAACLWFWMHEVGIDAKLQTAYETLIPDSNKSIAAKSEVIAEKIAEMGMKDEAQVTARCDMKGVMVDLESLNNVNRQTHRDCDFVLTNFDVRQELPAPGLLVPPQSTFRIMRGGSDALSRPGPGQLHRPEAGGPEDPEPERQALHRGVRHCVFDRGALRDARRGAPPRATHNPTRRPWSGSRRGSSTSARCPRGRASM